MKQIAVSIVIVTLLAVPGRGQNSVLQMVVSGSQQYSDISIDSLDGNDVLIRSGDKTARVPLDSVVEVHVSKPGNVMRSLSIGLVAGGATGFVVGQIIDGANDQQSDPTYYPSRNNKDVQFKVILPIVGGAVGGTIGAFVGSSNSDDVLTMTGRTTEEKKKVLIQFAQRAQRQPD